MPSVRSSYSPAANIDAAIATSSAIVIGRNLLSRTIWATAADGARAPSDDAREVMAGSVTISKSPVAFWLDLRMV